MDKLDAIKTFLRSAQLRSFSKAARELGMTPQTASKHVAQLESWVGVRLFNRTTHQVNLTEEGAVFFDFCAEAVKSIDEGVRVLRDASEAPTGVVRVTAPYTLGRNFLTPVLRDLGDQYPQLTIELLCEDRYTDIIQQKIDVGVRIGDLPDSSLVARRAQPIQLLLCASPDYLAGNPAIRKLDDLRRHKCICLKNATTGKPWPWTFQENGRVVNVEVTPSLIFNDADTQMEAVLNGAGVAQLAGFQAAPRLRSGQLKVVLKKHAMERHSIYVFTPHNRRNPMKTRLVSDLIYKTLREGADFKPINLKNV